MSNVIGAATVGEKETLLFGPENISDRWGLLIYCKELSYREYKTRLNSDINIKRILYFHPELYGTTTVVRNIGSLLQDVSMHTSSHGKCLSG